MWDCVSCAWRPLGYAALLLAIQALPLINPVSSFRCRFAAGQSDFSVYTVCSR